MKFQAFAPIHDLDGKPINGAVFHEFITKALLTDLAQEQLTDNGELKMKRFFLAQKIASTVANHSPDTSQECLIDLSPEEIVLIKDRVGKLYSTLVSARLWQILNGD